MSDKNGEARETTVLPPAMLPCATTTDVLGTRCAHGPTHGRTGQRLRNTHSGACVRCVAERQAKRGARESARRQPAAPPARPSADTMS